MASKDETSATTPEASSTPFYNLYENEVDSDVTLLVGHEGFQERVPAHSWVLAAGSDYFKALLQGPLAHTNNRVHKFPDDPKGFNNLIRWLYQHKCDLQSLQSSLDTLQVAIKYLCPDLAERCIIQITSQLNAKNVFRVLRWIYCYCAHQSPTTPSAPTLETIEYKESDESEDSQIDVSMISLDPTASCHQLLNECLDIIDKNADEVLNSEHFLSLDIPVLQMTLRRDTLNLTSETEVLKALYRWSTAECKRQHRPLTVENRRDVLGSLLYMSRILTISPSEVDSTMKDNVFTLLSREEIVFVRAYVKNETPLPAVPYTMVEYFTSMTIRRSPSPFENDSMTVALNTKLKKKLKFKKKFNKKEFILDLVSLLALIFD